MSQQFHRYQYNNLVNRHAVALAMLMRATGQSYEQINEHIERALALRAAHPQPKDS